MSARVTGVDVMGVGPTSAEVIVNPHGFATATIADIKLFPAAVLEVGAMDITGRCCGQLAQLGDHLARAARRAAHEHRTRLRTERLEAALPLAEMSLKVERDYLAAHPEAVA